ncbi:MAG: hypothetical protein Q8P95_02245, partial [bacterium]|nr:hypothetical protein [bacterium]
MKKGFLLSLVFLLLLGFCSQSVFAEEPTPDNGGGAAAEATTGTSPASEKKITIPFESNAPGVEHLSDIGLKDGKGQEGGVGFKDMIASIGGIIMRVLGAIALLFLFVAGYNLVTAQSKAAEEIETQKRTVVYVIIGLLIFAFSYEFIYEYLYENEGDFLLADDPANADPKAGAAGGAVAQAVKAVEQIKTLLEIFLSFAGVGAILMLIVASLRLIVNAGDEEQIKKQRNIVGYTALGIIIINMASILIEKIIFRSGGFEPIDVPAFESQLTGLSNYILGFLGTILLVSIILSGMAMVVYYGNDDIITKVKTTLKNIVIGTLVAYSAYSVVATALKLFI